MRCYSIQSDTSSPKLLVIPLIILLTFIPHALVLGEPLPPMTACLEARNLEIDPAVPGVVTLKFIDCFEQTLRVMRTFLSNELEGDSAKQEIMAPFLGVYDSSITKVLSTLRIDVLPLASAEELIDSDTVIAESGILEEMVALNQFLEPLRQPGATAYESKTGEIIETVIKSMKKIVDAIVDSFKVVAVKVKVVISILNVVIDEIIKIVRTVL